jgi:hypothetical protein
LQEKGSIGSAQLVAVAGIRKTIVSFKKSSRHSLLFNSQKTDFPSPFAFRMFLLAKLPAAFFAGLKLISIDPAKAVVSVRYNWFNRNPFGSLYFAVLSMAAEASTGILCIAAVQWEKRKVSMLIIKIEGNFIKKAVGKICFTCGDGLKIRQAMEETMTDGESRAIVCKSVGINETAEIVAEFFCTWSFKVRSK